MNSKIVNPEFEKNPSLVFEIHGNLALFARPDTGASETSSIIPPRSAIRGMIRSIENNVFVFQHIYKLEILKDPRVFYEYKINSTKNQLVTANNIKGGNSHQLNRQCLFDVAYRIHFKPVNLPYSKEIFDKIRPEKRESFRKNNAAVFYSKFKEKIKNGYNHVVHLGKNEFPSSYCGEPTSLNPFNIDQKIRVYDSFFIVNGEKESSSIIVDIKNGIVEYKDYEKIYYDYIKKNELTNEADFDKMVLSN